MVLKCNGSLDFQLLYVIIFTHMKIRDKLIMSFFVIVFLLLAAIIVKFFYIRQTWKELSRLSKGKTSVAAEEKLAELRGQAIQKHLRKVFEGQKNLSDDTSPLLILESSSKYKEGLEKARLALKSLVGCSGSASARRFLSGYELAMNQVMTLSEFFAVSKASDYTKTGVYKNYKVHKKPDPEFIARLLRPHKSMCLQLANILPLKELAAKVRKAYGKGRFTELQEQKKARQSALQSLDGFSSLIQSAGVPGVGDLPIQLQSPMLKLLDARKLDELRSAWNSISTLFATISSQIPPPTAHPMVGRISNAIEGLQAAWHNYVRATVEVMKRESAGRQAFDSFSKESSQSLVMAAKLDVLLLRKLAQRCTGAEGAAEEFTEELLSALSSMPIEAVNSSEAGQSLSLLYERKKWALVYEQRLQDLTLMIVLFGLGVVLAFGFSFMVYRDINHPIEILKNSLNNLSMGGEKRRINLKLPNEFGSLIEAYNRYLDNLTSTSKRLVECSSCRNPYEMGDSFCRQCGRKLRFYS